MFVQRIIPKVARTLPLIATLSLMPIVANAQTNKETAQQDTVTTAVTTDNLVDSQLKNRKDTLSLSDATEIKTEIVTKTKTKVKDGVKKWLSSDDIKTTAGVRILGAETIPGIGIGADLMFYNDKATAGIDFAFANTTDANAILYNVFAQYNFDMGKGFTVGPEIELSKINIKSTDKTQEMSVLSPKIGAGIQYHYTFSNGIDIYARGNISGALRMVEQASTEESVGGYKSSGVGVDAYGLVGASYKNLMLFVKGGYDKNIGGNVGTGINFIF